ncbi:myristoyl transferase [Alkalihalophilus pseudofirmus]|nr:myristoyl transferase [Alkalihalophilus pseudofirmus]
MKKSIQLFVLMIAIVFFLVACGSSNDTSSGSVATESDEEVGSEETNGDTEILGEPEVTDITLRLNWRFKGEFSPFYVAVEKGIFEKYGLNVEVLEGNGSTNTMQAIAQGQDDFGVTSTVEPSQGIAEGMPIQMIATYTTRSPIIIASHPDTPVETPKDLEGKRIAMSIASTFTNIYPFFLESNGVDDSAVTPVQVESSARNGLFLNKEVDAVAIFSSNEYPIFEKELGVELTPLYLADFGYDLAGLSIIGNTRFLEGNPNTTKRFLAALDEAFAYTFENKEEAVAIVKDLFPEAVDEEIVLLQIELFEEIAAFDDVPYGYMSEQNMIDTLDILEVSSLISERYELERYYTNEFFMAE